MTTENPPRERPLLVWDRDCELCAKIVARIAYQVGDCIDRAPYQDVVDRVPDCPAAIFAHSIHLIDTDGRIWVGVAAGLRAQALGNRTAGLWCYEHVPGFAGLCQLVYLALVRHRRLASRLVRWFVGPDLLPRQYRLTRWLFLRLLGVVMLAAFASMAVQLDGLLGEGGIVPAADFMKRMDEIATAREAQWGRAEAGGVPGWHPLERYLTVPTLGWIGTDNQLLWALVIAGMTLALLLIADVAPGPCILGMWTSYLSLVTMGGVFFRYQWDVLLLESLLVAMFLAPWRLRPRLSTDSEPSLAGVWLVRLLVFKLMLLSGVVKLLANDPVWDQLTALEYHFFTQPIPTWTAYYAHHLPSWLLAVATLLMFVVEVGLPWFVLGPRRLRMGFALGTMFLMAMIASTGNYGFFNMHTAILAIMLFDDSALRRLVPRRWRDTAPAISAPRPSRRPPRRVVHWLTWTLAGGVLAASALTMYGRLVPRSDMAQAVMAPIRPFLSINAYGLFADMTTMRPEIVVAGSHDGITWTAYQFRWKPGAETHRPNFAGPHMPRLDWQMWFAALRGCQRASWFHRFLQRLLEGAPAVRSLLAHDPFGDQPPRYVRTTLYRYTFTELGADTWWQRERVGAYCPTVMLRAGRVVVAPDLPPASPPAPQ